MTPARSVNVMLCAESVHDFEDALAEEGDQEEVALRDDLPFDARLFVQFDRRNQPSWLRLLQDGTTRDLGELFNVSQAAVLVIKRATKDGAARYFALPFGRGRHLIEENAYVREFGLKVALNTIDPDQLVSLDIHTLEELPFHRRMQASRAAPPAAFDLDSYRDALTSVTGKPTDESSQRLTGTDAVRLTRRLELDDLGALCDELLEDYEGERYRERFEWIDHLRRVRIPAMREQLDSQLVAALRELQAGEAVDAEVWLAPPEVIDWSQTEGFWITGTRRRRVTTGLLAEPDLSWYLEELGDPDAIEIDKLKQHRLEVRESVDEPPLYSWSLYRALVAEREFEDRLYVLINGTWFEIARTLAEEVNAVVGDLEESGIALPAAIVGEHEPDYNARASDDDLYLLDRVPVKASPTEGHVESCDLFHRDGIFVHVKRYRKGSAELSHLFAQGAVSAHAFMREAVHRRDLQEKLAARADDEAWVSDVVSQEQPDASDYEIAYAIIAHDWPEGPVSLPFFAKLTLTRAYRELGRLGYAVTLTRIPVVAP